jgi:hypothetical protein
MKCKYVNCNNELTGKQTVHCSQKCSVSNYIKRKRVSNKVKAVEYKGGCCQRCGYNKSLRALNFHHLDPKEKDFHISDNGNLRNWEAIEAELNKCILLCANCHAEEHDRLYK